MAVSIDLQALCTQAGALLDEHHETGRREPLMKALDVIAQIERGSEVLFDALPKARRTLAPEAYQDLKRAAELMRELSFSFNSHFGALVGPVQ